MMMKKKNGARYLSIMLQTLVVLTVMADGVAAVDEMNKTMELLKQRFDGTDTEGEKLSKEVGTFLTAEKNLIKKLKHMGSSVPPAEAPYKKVHADQLFPESPKNDTWFKGGDSATILGTLFPTSGDGSDGFNNFELANMVTLETELGIAGSAFGPLLAGKANVKYDHATMRDPYFKLADVSGAFAAVSGGAETVNDLCVALGDDPDVPLNQIVQDVMTNATFDVSAADDEKKLLVEVKKVTDILAVGGAVDARMVDQLKKELKVPADSNLARVKEEANKLINKNVVAPHGLEKWVSNYLLKNGGLNDTGEFFRKLCDTQNATILGKFHLHKTNAIFINALNLSNGTVQGSTADIASMIKDPDFIAELKAAEAARDKELKTAEADLVAATKAFNDGITQAEQDLDNGQKVLKFKLQTNSTLTAYSTLAQAPVKALAVKALQSFLTVNKSDPKIKETGPLGKAIKSLESFLTGIENDHTTAKWGDFDGLFAAVTDELSQWVSGKNGAANSNNKNQAGDADAEDLGTKLRALLVEIKSEFNLLEQAELALDVAQNNQAAVNGAQDARDALFIDTSVGVGAVAADAHNEIDKAIKSLESYVKLDKAIEAAVADPDDNNLADVTNAVKGLIGLNSVKPYPVFNNLDTITKKIQEAITVQDDISINPSNLIKKNTLKEVLENAVVGSDGLYNKLTDAGFTTGEIANAVKASIEKVFAEKIEVLELGDVFTDIPGGGFNTKALFDITKASATAFQKIVLDKLNAVIEKTLTDLPGATPDASIDGAVAAVKKLQLLDDGRVDIMGDNAANAFAASANGETVSDVKAKLTSAGEAALATAVGGVLGELEAALKMDGEKDSTKGASKDKFFLDTIQTDVVGGTKVDTLKTEIQDAFKALVDEEIPNVDTLTYGKGTIQKCLSIITSLHHTMGSITSDAGAKLDTLTTKNRLEVLQKSLFNIINQKNDIKSQLLALSNQNRIFRDEEISKQEEEILEKRQKSVQKYKESKQPEAPPLSNNSNTTQPPVQTPAAATINHSYTYKAELTNDQLSHIAEKMLTNEQLSFIAAEIVKAGGGIQASAQKVNAISDTMSLPQAQREQLSIKVAEEKAKEEKAAKAETAENPQAANVQVVKKPAKKSKEEKAKEEKAKEAKAKEEKAAKAAKKEMDKKAKKAKKQAVIAEEMAKMAAQDKTDQAEQLSVDISENPQAANVKGEKDKNIKKRNKKPVKKSKEEKAKEAKAKEEKAAKAEIAEKPQAVIANQKTDQLFVQENKSAVIASAVLAEIQAVDPRVKNTASLNNRGRLSNYIKKAGNKAKRAQFVSANPNWLTGLKGWNDYLVQQVKTLEGQKSTLEGQKSSLKIKNALSDLKKRTENLKKMIDMVTPILDQSTNWIAPVAKNNAPKALTSQQKQEKRREQRALKAKQAEERAAAKKVARNNQPVAPNKAAAKNDALITQPAAVNKAALKAKQAEERAAAKRELAKKEAVKKEAGNNQKSVNQKPVAAQKAEADAAAKLKAKKEALITQPAAVNKPAAKNEPKAVNQKPVAAQKAEADAAAKRELAKKEAAPKNNALITQPAAVNKAALKAKQAEERAAAKKAKKEAGNNQKAVNQKPVAPKNNPVAPKNQLAANKDLENKAPKKELDKRELAKKAAENNQPKAVNQKPVAPNKAEADAAAKLKAKKEALITQPAAVNKPAAKKAAAVKKELIPALNAAKDRLSEAGKKALRDKLKSIVDAEAKLKAEKEAQLKGIAG